MVIQYELGYYIHNLSKEHKLNGYKHSGGQINMNAIIYSNKS